jgi:uncharacterized membrane protein YoaK (UPF0700 family)
MPTASTAAKDGKQIRFRAWPRPVSMALAIALIPQAAFFAVWITAPSPASTVYVLIALAAFAMGLQMNAVRSLHVPGISSTAFTATLVGSFSSLTTWALTAPLARRLDRGHGHGQRGR